MTEVISASRKERIKWLAWGPVAFMLWIVGPQLVRFTMPQHLPLAKDPREARAQIAREQRALQRYDLVGTCVTSGVLFFFGAVLGLRGVRILQARTFPAPGAELPFAARRHVGWPARMVAIVLLVSGGIFCVEACILVLLHYRAFPT
jgi:hypothetical protein